MVDQSGEAQSQLYLLRIWAVPGGGGTPGCRGKLQPVLSAHSYCFASASELFTLLVTLLAGSASAIKDDAESAAGAAPGSPTTQEG